MKKKPLTPLVKNGGYIASKDYTPLVYPGGKTTQDNGGSAGKSGEDTKPAEDGKEE